MSFKNLKNTRSLSLITAIAMMAIMLLPAVTAALPAQFTADRATATLVSVAPKVIGKGQTLTVNLWVVPAPSGPTYYAQDIEGYHNVTCTITSPDGHSDTFMPLDQSFKDSGHPDLLGETEAVGTLYFYYVPTQVGTDHISASFPGETRYLAGGPTGGENASVYYKPSSSKSLA